MRTPQNWDILSQKKDIEEIKKLLKESNEQTKEKNNFFIRGLISFFIIMMSSMIAALTNHYWQDLEIFQMILLIALIILVIIILASIPFISELKKCFHQKKFLTPSEENKLVDYFDNNIIYYIMMANCYYKMSIKKNISSNDKEFFQIECEYYLFKSLHGIASLQKLTIINDVDYEFNGQEKKISSKRITIAIKYLDDIARKLYNNKFSEKLENLFSVCNSLLI